MSRRAPWQPRSARSSLLQQDRHFCFRRYSRCEQDFSQREIAPWTAAVRARWAAVVFAPTTDCQHHWLGRRQDLQHSLRQSAALGHQQQRASAAEPTRPPAPPPLAARTPHEVEPPATAQRAHHCTARSSARSAPRRHSARLSRASLRWHSACAPSPMHRPNLRRRQSGAVYPPSS